MKNYKISNISKFLDRPGFTGTFVHGERMSLVHWIIEKDTPLALHSHENEQILFVLEGCLRFDSPVGQIDVFPGEGIVFAPDEPHSGIAVETTVCLDAFCPVREDFIKAMEGK
ncbi:MAG: cupin domain-containing protein [Synergistaceae bacterium]|nr:cupin domain-containing protein [Synergistaceae bacterium]